MEKRGIAKLRAVSDQDRSKIRKKNNRMSGIKRAAELGVSGAFVAHLGMRELPLLLLRRNVGHGVKHRALLRQKQQDSENNIKVLPQFHFNDQPNTPEGYGNLIALSHSVKP